MQTDIGQKVRTTKESLLHLHILQNIKEIKSQTHSNHGHVFVPCLASFYVSNVLLLGFLPLPELSPSFLVIDVVYRILVFLA